MIDLWISIKTYIWESDASIIKDQFWGAAHFPSLYKPLMFSTVEKEKLSQCSKYTTWWIFKTRYESLVAHF